MLVKALKSVVGPKDFKLMYPDTVSVKVLATAWNGFMPYNFINLFVSALKLNLRTTSLSN